MEDLVSVIIPVYNGEKYINKCIESINLQTYKNIEIIIINDGSIDKTQIILESICEKQENVKLITQINQGTAIAKNQGIHIANGKYVIFLDSDDTLNENSIEFMVEKIKKENAQMVRTTFLFDYDGTLKKGDEKIENKIYSNSNKMELIRKLLIDEIHGFCSGVLLIERKMLIESKIEFDGTMRIMEDFIFLCTLVEYANTIITLNFETLYYFQNCNGITKSFSDIKCRWNNIETRLNYNKCIIKKYPELEKYADNVYVYIINMYIKTIKYIMISKNDNKKILTEELYKKIIFLMGDLKINIGQLGIMSRILLFFIRFKVIFILEIVFKLEKMCKYGRN